MTSRELLPISPAGCFQAA